VKIFEITDKNLGWSKLSGVETEFDYGYDEIVTLLELLIKLKSRHRVTTALPAIVEFERRLNEFVDEPFPDEDDADLDNRRNRAQTMLSEISSLKQQLP